MNQQSKIDFLDPIAKKNIDLWLQGNYDKVTKDALSKSLRDNPAELNNAFYKNLSFGTGGLRGVMGLGTNRMNLYTVQTATQGVANYLHTQILNPIERSVFIGYDSRHQSQFFAEVAAKVLAGNGIRVYLFNELRPTPLLSFGCRLKHCAAAIMITASHNPPQYNGYKVFWNDGAQVLPPHDIKIIEEVNKISDISMVKSIDIPHPLIEIVDNQVDDAYLKSILILQHYPTENHKYGHKVKVVYSSLHGTGITLMPKALEAWGFTNVAYVKEQIIPDGNFPTVQSPNPEDRFALQMGIDLLNKINADILIATDPDADRVGVAVLHKGEPVLLTGNQVACLCLNHICDALTKQNKMPEDAAFIKTIVTTELFEAIAHEYHKPCVNVLTGFKYIAEKIHQWEQSPDGLTFLFGGEESYGYLLGTLTRDKDAILSSALICEVALQCKLESKTLIDKLYEIYNKHGVHYESLNTFKFPESPESNKQMHKKMLELKNKPPTLLNGQFVVCIEDYFSSMKINLVSGKVESLDFPKSEVLIFRLQNGTKVAIRPSGTESQIKIYCASIKKEFFSIGDALKECEEECKQIVTIFQKHFLT